jgi:hypothetical protein
MIRSLIATPIPLGALGIEDAVHRWGILNSLASRNHVGVLFGPSPYLRQGEVPHRRVAGLQKPGQGIIFEEILPLFHVSSPSDRLRLSRTTPVEDLLEILAGV